MRNFFMNMYFSYLDVIIIYYICINILIEYPIVINIFYYNCIMLYIFIFYDCVCFVRAYEQLGTRHMSLYNY